MITSLLLLAAQAAVPPSTIQAKAADKIRCQLEYQANSRIPNRICLPKSEWERIAKETEADMNNSRNGRASGRLGTIVDSSEGTITAPKIPGWPR
jgi:hypothetical protein